MASYLPYEPQQQMLLPEALQDWLPEGHLACFISDAVDGLDLSAFHARYNSGGPRNQPFHPAMMAKVLVYAYASGVFSSRKIAALLNKGKSADEAEKNEPELDKQGQREADIKRGRSDDEDRKPRGKDGKPKGGAQKDVHLAGGLRASKGLIASASATEAGAMTLFVCSDIDVARPWPSPLTPTLSPQAGRGSQNRLPRSLLGPVSGAARCGGWTAAATTRRARPR
jgi:hypothetical protein